MGHLGAPGSSWALKVIQAGNDTLKKAWVKHRAAEAESKAEAGQQEPDQAAMDEDIQDFLPEDEVIKAMLGKEATREGAKRLLEATTKKAKKQRSS